MTSYGGELLLDYLLLEVASPIILLLLHSAAIKIYEAKDSIDEEDQGLQAPVELHHVVLRASSSR